MVVNSQYIYGSYRFSSKKADQSHTHTTKLQVQQYEVIHTTCSAKSKMKATDLANKLIDTLFCTWLHCISKCGIEDN